MLLILKGSDLLFRLVWPGEEGQPMNLTDWTVEPYDEIGLIRDKVELSIEEPLTGVILGSIPWDDGFPYGNTMGFRVLIRNEPMQFTTPQIKVNVQ